MPGHSNALARSLVVRLDERLTRQEERWSLYACPGEIGTRNGWNALLERYGFCYRGHRMVRAKS